MATRLSTVFLGALGELRYEPCERRLRATLGGRPAVDTRAALILWEPGRVVPSYAVPEADVLGELTPEPPPPARVPDPATAGFPLPGGRRGLTPADPFAIHTADGEPLTVRADGAEAPGAAFRLADPALAGHVVLDFAAFDDWREEEDPVVGHPRDPFHRIDVVRSTRHVRVELAGELLAESTRPHLLSETNLPVRSYLPREDVRMELLEPSGKRTVCAYKGFASYWSAPGEPDLVWTYEDPLNDALPVRGLLSFFDERVDVTVDGERRERPRTPWSPAKG